MTKAEQIKNKLKGLHEKGHYNTSAVIIGTVNAINGIDTIDVDVDGVIYNDVQLQAIVEGNGTSIIIVPTKGSSVLIGNIENGTNYVLLHANKVDRILLKQVDGMFIDIVKGVVKLNGDDKGGLVQIQELKDNLDALKSFVEAMNNALPSAFTAVGISSAANGTTASIAYQTSMAGKIITIKDMENKKVKHGG
jgi:hypothetical protein